METFFTYVPEIDHEILLTLTDEELPIICRSSKYAQELCNETFWMKKFYIEFGVLINGYMRNEDTYELLYKELKDKTVYDLWFIAMMREYSPLIKEIIKTRTGSAKRTFQLLTLEYASKIGNLEIIKYIVENGSRDLIRADNDAVLRNASKNGHYDIVKYLLENGAGLNGLHTNNDEALVSAAENGHYDIVNLLIRYGADINVLQ